MDNMDNMNNFNQMQIVKMSHDCSFCRENPRSHSFTEIQAQANINRTDSSTERRLFYSRPADAELYRDTISVVHHFECVLEGVGDWEWIFDCDRMGIAHYTQFELCRELCKLFVRQGGLRRVYIINTNWLIGVTIKCAKAVWHGLPEIWLE